MWLDICVQVTKSEGCRGIFRFNGEHWTSLQNVQVKLYCVVREICEMVSSRGDLKGTESRRDQRSLSENELFVAEFIQFCLIEVAA